MEESGKRPCESRFRGLGQSWTPHFPQKSMQAVADDSLGDFGGSCPLWLPGAVLSRLRPKASVTSPSHMPLGVGITQSWRCVELMQS